MTETPCFMLTPLPRAQRLLRRTQMLRRGYQCQAETPVLGHTIWRHEATRVLDECFHSLLHTERVGDHSGVPEADWPERCTNRSCPDLATGGYVFQKDDPKLLLLDRLYLREDGGDPVVLSGKLPPGGVYDVAPNLPSGPDGRSLCVVLPDGKPWFVDVQYPSGETFVRDGSGACLTLTQVAGDPWPWALVDGVIRPV